MGSLCVWTEEDGVDQLWENGYSESAESLSSCSLPYYYDRDTDDDDCTSSYLTSSPIQVMLPVIQGRHVSVQGKKAPKGVQDVEGNAVVELMKERFAKLLLGEDMSGKGNGVCTALAISNAITDLGASVFGQLWKLEPLAQERKSLWRREMEWFLCASNSIVQLVPSIQEMPGGGTCEVMVPRQRSDLYENLPALKKIDAELLSILDWFENPEFYYIDKGILVAGADISETLPCSSSERRSDWQEKKWWLPFPEVPRNGLSENMRKRLLHCRECVTQIHKASQAINRNVLDEMEIPNDYLKSLPDSGKACLGEIMCGYMTSKKVSPDRLLDYLNLTSDCGTLELANRVEAATHVWRQKYEKTVSAGKTIRSSIWGGKVFAGETTRCKILAKRAETLLHKLRLRVPDLPQTALDTSKIRLNKDVGFAIIESYSRVMESLAFSIKARIDDLLDVDGGKKQYVIEESRSCVRECRRLGCILLEQRRLPRCLPSLANSPCSSPSATPNFDSSRDLSVVTKKNW